MEEEKRNASHLVHQKCSTMGLIVWADLESPWLLTWCFFLAVRLFGKLPGDMCYKYQRCSEVIWSIVSKHQHPLSTKIRPSFGNTCHHFVKTSVCPQNGDWSHVPPTSYLSFLQKYNRISCFDNNLLAWPTILYCTDCCHYVNVS